MSRQSAQAMTQLDVAHEIAIRMNRYAPVSGEPNPIQSVEVRSEHRMFVTLKDGRSYQLFIQEVQNTERFPITASRKRAADDMPRCPECDGLTGHTVGCSQMDRC